MVLLSYHRCSVIMLMQVNLTSSDFHVPGTGCHYWNLLNLNISSHTQIRNLEKCLVLYLT